MQTVPALLLFLSSCCPADGAPLTELSWSTSLVVVGVSFSGLFTFVLLMLACLCCRRRRRIRFKVCPCLHDHVCLSVHQNVTLILWSNINADLFCPPVQLLQPTDLGRRNLFYLKEIGNGWFGKVLLGEINPGLTSTQVVVKELKTSASVHEQMHFLEEARPFRTLQHPALLQCLVQCTEVSPYLLVMEFCPLGDVKGYLRGCRRGEVVTPEPLVLQQMACDITAGLLHLHKHGFTHSDLALRNCLLTSDHSVKIGDYGLSQTKYKEDYYLTSDQSYVPLRWIAPELVDEVHGNLLVSEHTPQSNIWSLGVTIWELFEFGNQPYRNYTDRQVLAYTVKEQQLRLKIPLLRVPLAERWYEVMQFCWLQPEQRPTAEEVHLLLTYLCAKGASEAEEDFERRWNSMCPNTGHHRPSALSQDHPSLSSSSFPLLEQFSAGDGYHSGDDVLTVTETSQGLNFEYKWEQARAHLSHGVSSSYYEPKHLHAPGVLPVLSAHSPSVNSEYYIRIEEPVGADSGESEIYDSSDSSPAISLTMEPLLGHVTHNSPLRAWESSHYVSYKDRDGGYYFENSPPLAVDPYLMGDEQSSIEHLQESWGSRSLRQALGELEHPLGQHRRTSHSCRQDTYVDFHYTMPSTDIEDSWPKDHSLVYHSLPRPIHYPEPRHAKDNSACLNLSKHSSMPSSENFPTYIYLCHEDEPPAPPPGQCCHSHFVDPLAGLLVRNSSYTQSKPVKDKMVDVPSGDEMINLSPAPGGPHSEVSQTGDSGLGQDSSSTGLVDILDCSDDEEDEDITEDITDVTSGIFVDDSSELNASPALKSLQKQVGTPDSMDSIDLPPGVCEGFSPGSSHPSSSPKALDSGYNTENNQSPEFVLKEPHETTEDSQGTGDHIFLPLSDKTPYRDSAYFSDYENERVLKDEGAEEQSEVTEEQIKEPEGEQMNNKNEEKSEEPSAAGTEEAEDEEGSKFAQTVALQHSANARRFSSSSSTPPSTPPPPLGVTDGQGPSANGEEWNEEQRANSDDSDDSDEELQSYAVQEESEDDEECHLVPIVVSDDSHVHTLRSLLKTPTTLVADSQEEALKKTVSFFDDVTVYLFDQESPTQELTENCFLLETEGQRSENSSKEKLNTSDDSSDGNVSEESAGYEWEDDFSLLPLPTSAVTSDSPPKNVMVDPPHRAPVAKQETKMSRFTVSRFSITHVSDSDVESVGGE
uniref:non-specific serine/threonine protein kinase n=1 Tax=Cynoglossus semilaevis TaxID=244447 RepID=A0A3P8UFN8_CYNSE